MTNNRDPNPPPDPYPDSDDTDITDDAAAQAAREVLGENTTPEPVPQLDITMLPEVVAELATTSERDTGRIDDLTATVAGHTDAIVDMHEALTTLERTLTDQHDQTRPSRWALPFLPPQDAQQLLTETRWFVDHILGRYPFTGEVRIPPCWYRHPLAVDELTAVYAAWREAYCSTDHPTNALTAWWDRWLWPMLHRLATHADWQECKQTRTHTPPPTTPPTTDTNFHTHITTDLPSPITELPWAPTDTGDRDTS